MSQISSIPIQITVKIPYIIYHVGNGHLCLVLTKNLENKEKCIEGFISLQGHYIPHIYHIPHASTESENEGLKALKF